MSSAIMIDGGLPCSGTMETKKPRGNSCDHQAGQEDASAPCRRARPGGCKPITEIDPACLHRVEEDTQADLESPYAGPPEMESFGRRDNDPRNAG